MNAPPWVAVPVVILLALAARADVRTRRIPNRLTLPALLLGVAMHMTMEGTVGLTTSLSGLAFAGGVLLPGYLFGWMGAGDVKLMMAVGAWLGWPVAVLATLGSLIAGGAIALVVGARRRMLGQALRSAGLIAQSVVMRANMGGLATTGVRFPFAVAVFAGTVLALVIRP